MHKFKKVKEYIPFRTACYYCGTTTKSQDLWADLNGEAFKAYYCNSCKNKAEKRDLKQEN